MCQRIVTAGILVLCLTAGVSEARADGFFVPWAGVNFGNDIDDGRGAFGVTAGGMSAGVIGGEVTLGYSPSAFGNENDFGNNTVIDLMANLVVGIPIGGQRGGGFRPYVSGGLGLLRTQIDGGDVFDVEASNNDLGWNAGGGAMAYFGDHVGIRGDLRYFRNITGDTIRNLDFGDFDYWRASFGVVFR